MLPATTFNAASTPRPEGVGALLLLYRERKQLKELTELINSPQLFKARLNGVPGSLAPLALATVSTLTPCHHLAILPDKESAAYFYNDLETFLSISDALFFPSTQTKPYSDEEEDTSALLLRAEVLNELAAANRPRLIVTYPEALVEKVVNRSAVEQHTFVVKTGQQLNLDFMLELLIEYGFERTDFVYEPGQFSIRGGIVDVFSFANENPYRIELFGDEVESIRTFDVENQLSILRLQELHLLPNVQKQLMAEKREGLLEYLPGQTLVWIQRPEMLFEKIQDGFQAAVDAWEALRNKKTGEVIVQAPPFNLFESATSLKSKLEDRNIIFLGAGTDGNITHDFNLGAIPQTAIRKNFKVLSNTLISNEKKGMRNLIFFDNRHQYERLFRIFKDIDSKITFHPLFVSIHEGFNDPEGELATFTDHQLFERYHRYRLKDFKLKSRALTLKELKELQRGDLVVHIDHGVGKYDGLEKLDVNGKVQEAVRLLYRDNDLLYVGINSLHKISKYSASEGAQPSLNKLGSDTWEKLKTKTKRKVKDIAKDLIKLYAQRRAQKGFAFNPDSYLIHELEASFIYEETPDQGKAIQAVKTDMEKEMPMDRLVCGDVGFGKTEVAIRAAFKAACDGKQVAVLVPTTILAFQHYKTFSERLAEFPVKVDYINRFRTAKETKEVLQNLAEGKIDIVIGTHAIVGKQMKFKDLGLLIIDEEQKFGVSVKEKLKQFRVNVDTLTLTATPIPRTLQFSLMGARDFSVINTPPPNRQPVTTELIVFNEDRIKDAIRTEISRGGQVFFVHNRVKTIQEIAGMIQRLVPEARICVAHGQMEGEQLEETLLAFMDGSFDVLVATNIIESGLDISNANTIIIHQAHMFGLSDLHQMRGRVGRSNIKAYCYLIVPPLTTLTNDARRRLKAIEEFSDLASGFNIALKDLDIRGAGNLLGGEQSGFISEIGFEMYHKILDEAIAELKEDEFAELFKDEPDRPFVSDCQIETDLEAHFPEKYINNTTERLSIYMDLDNLSGTEDELAEFRQRLIDRFGPMPAVAENLFGVIRLRKAAKEIGVEKLTLKNEKMRCTLVSGSNQRFFQSELFGKILMFVQMNPNRVSLKQKGETGILEFGFVRSVDEARDLLIQMNA